MKFAVVALASTAAAGVTVRQASLVQGVLSSVQSATEKVDSAAKAYTGGVPSDALDAAKNLVSAITDGESKVKGSSALGATDAVTLAGPVNSLTSVSKQLVADLVAKRDLVEKAGQCSEVRSSVSDVNDAGSALISEVIGKVDGPQAIKDVASSLAAPLQSILAQAVADFGTASCVDAAGGSGGSSATSSSAAAATTSAAASSSSSKAAATSSTGGYAPPPASTSAAAATTTPSGPASTPTAHPASAALIAPAGIMALALAVFAL